MQPIQLLSVENVVSRKKSSIEHTLVFFMRIDNLSYDKQVEVIWTQDGESWQVLAAQFHSKCGDHKEYWLARVEQTIASRKAPSGEVQIACRIQSVGHPTYWDNNHGQNYVSEANSGLKLFNGLPLLNVYFSDSLAGKTPFFPVTVAVDPALQADQVLVHWTTDNWHTTTITPCHARKLSPAHLLKSHTKPHKPPGSERWKGRLNLKGAFRIQYCISCEANGRIYWDNNDGQNYSAQHKPLTVLILNLHCYQEDQQDYKFSQIAKAIDELEADVVCLQEVAELWNNGEGDWPSNSARIINDRLQRPYHLHTDWSHLGFDKYREGVAILSRYPITKHDARYVSDSHDIYSIHSRKVVMGQIAVPGIGLLNVFSAHLSWWEDGFAEQFKRLSAWAAEKQTASVKATLLCGDFNIAAGSTGYDLVVTLNEYDDQFLAINSQAVFDKIFKVNDPYWQHYLNDDYRIDYIFMNKTSTLRAMSGDVLFTEHDYGQVSDHCGYVMRFEPRV